jgi:stage V sporulation protein SpoVS
LDPSEFVPRAVAPEATNGLKALRAVANTSTRSAIDRHQRRSLDTKAIISGFIALVAFAVAVAMGYLALDAESLVSIPTFLCLSSGFMGVLAAVKALAYSATAALSSRRQQNLKQLSAR